jgi:hypothetical protein
MLSWQSAELIEHRDNFTFCVFENKILMGVFRSNRAKAAGRWSPIKIGVS